MAVEGGVSGVGGGRRVTFDGLALLQGGGANIPIRSILTKLQQAPLLEKRYIFKFSRARNINFDSHEGIPTEPQRLNSVGHCYVHM